MIVGDHISLFSDSLHLVVQCKVRGFSLSLSVPCIGESFECFVFGDSGADSGMCQELWGRGGSIPHQTVEVHSPRELAHVFFCCPKACGETKA